MDGLLSQLRDIRGLDPVSWWPPAPGWWLIPGILIVAAVIVLIVRRRNLAREASLQAEINRTLNELRINKNNSLKQKAALLSELLRRLAIARYGRIECAGLQGRNWLRWLTNNDPGGFSWDKNGAILIEAPYMPEDGATAVRNWDDLLDAAERWVK
jgi:Domain of unknown function (DUF4381)